MDNLRNFRRPWYVRIELPKIGYKIEKPTPLKTKSKVIARE